MYKSLCIFLLWAWPLCVTLWADLHICHCTLATCKRRANENRRLMFRNGFKESKTCTRNWAHAVPEDKFDDVRSCRVPVKIELKKTPMFVLLGSITSLRSIPLRQTPLHNNCSSLQFPTKMYYRPRETPILDSGCNGSQRRTENEDRSFDWGRPGIIPKAGWRDTYLHGQLDVNVSLKVRFRKEYVDLKERRRRFTNVDEEVDAMLKVRLR